MSLLSYVVPGWLRLVAVAVIAGAMFLLGQLHGERVAGEFHNDYISKQASQTVAIGKAQTKVVTETQTVYKDRFIEVYEQGEKNEQDAPAFVTASDSAACVINAGFVRNYNAAWAGNDTGPPASADREPAGVSLTDVAETTAHNATSCIAWREQALGLRDFYKKLQVVTNTPQE
ncbi:hypothetical protein UNDKW_2909 [Undibacterium sp. KW1]|uniref:hypothetical protein n=1 Tax=Undibacterium sp. KW1 TaxID=2058624 RepID=UPI001331EAF6|nr:hypothetical protein [Undibacterium sp. KW1]BBB61182.1 hypothetical protein UNDKW_2909 [Undibacterium sp. KW1]